MEEVGGGWRRLEEVRGGWRRLEEICFFILGVFYSEYANRPSPLSTNGHLLVVVAHRSRQTGVQDAFSLFFMPKMKNPLEGGRTERNELIASELNSFEKFV